MAANMWENRLKNVESDNNKILYENLLDFLQRNGTYFLNNPRTYVHKYINNTYIHIYTHTNIHTYLHKYIHTYMHTLYGSIIVYQGQ